MTKSLVPIRRSNPVRHIVMQKCCPVSTSSEVSGGVGPLQHLCKRPEVVELPTTILSSFLLGNSTRGETAFTT